MRNIVLQMMTTLDGRLDDPLAWMGTVVEEQYRAIDRLYAGYDTVLVGRTTYEEMVGYWPGALADDANGETNRIMAKRMHDYRKIVFSRAGEQAISPWNNAEKVVALDDAALSRYLMELKAAPGGDIHLSGGASLAQTVIGLGLVDRYHFFVYPVVSPGEPWFARLREKNELRLMGSEHYSNGVVGVHYAAVRGPKSERPRSFSELIA
ncbi:MULTISPECIES: dihydrofolate reductase family protein [unclassified Ensifer]|uniref:dihydrofolate reductase family protein n=1 Tax=unclassified Ensifer TaxID=2633371 RepID=UPI0008131DB3|nr:MULTISPECIES: dihydrofolate reductase family protein [unclassified Ensifer]OCO98731.1 riboflavin biosynthesis protein RibD [Ensifer sp. LC14]OCP13210.1 riboflavin biosynthesis protein RibD [Ensifer sp. LC13]OCP13814.1 riboflavin biosynthesis protein RibD [Ensifer sp. LC11]OCP28190.1 riboflavin biosynthesis protein RibD [Ensifer sp. LC499]